MARSGAWSDVGFGASRRFLDSELAVLDVLLKTASAVIHN